MPISSFEIGATYAAMANLESLTVPLPVPRAPFKPYARIRRAVSGKSIGQGLPVCQWIFSRLTPLQREQLRYFCTGASAAVYIRTMTNEADTGQSVTADAYHDYLAVMHWPEDERRDPAKTHDRLELVIEFTHLVLIPEPVP
jgi:hypothetical protein